MKRILTTPSYASAHYTKDYDPELAAKALKPFAKGTIGYVGTYQMSYAMLDYIKRAFPQARFVDATDMVDRIKVIKSAEEMELVKRAALMQDGAMRAAFAAVKPGMRDTEVAAVAQHYSQCHGSENGIYLCASMPLGTAVEIRPTAMCRTASSRRATRSRCWSRTTARAACTPSSAAPAWSAPRCRRR